MNEFYDRRLNGILKSVAGKGAYPWSFFRDAYCGAGKKNTKFTRRMMEYEALSPRIIITRPYNVSESPMVEVLNG
jgi:hypothetical protein